MLSLRNVRLALGLGMTVGLSPPGYLPFPCTIV